MADKDLINTLANDLLDKQASGAQLAVPPVTYT